ncbi:MAG: nucleotide exchange factor GrpE [Bryobacter sp.]|nr:nucleotide exchange factor GrpE [Bryobacter sp.]
MSEQELENQNQEGASAEAVVDTETDASLEGRIAELEAERAELLRLAQTRQAEFENFRRRVERERAETIDFAAGEAVKAVLSVFDDFERSLAVETTDHNYAKGVQLIHNRFREVLEKLGLEPLESVGKAFDPNVHHGIEMVETDEAEDQTVLGEFQRGYLFRGKLLRPAMVRVAVKK